MPAGFILQNFSNKNKKEIPKLPFGKKIFIYLTLPYIFHGDNPEDFIYIEEGMTIADLLIKIGFFKNIEQYEKQRKLYKIVKNSIKELPYTMEILGIDDPSTGHTNIQDTDSITIQDNITKPSPGLDYGRKQSYKRNSRKKSRKRSSRKRSSRKRKLGKRKSGKRKSGKRKSGKRSSRKRNNYHKSSPKYKFKYKLESSKYPKTEKFANCVSELARKSKHKRWPKSGSRRESMLRPFKNACLKKLNLKKSK